MLGHVGDVGDTGGTCWTRAGCGTFLARLRREEDDMQKPSAKAIKVLVLGLSLAAALAAAGCYVRAAAGPGYYDADLEVEGPPPPAQNEVVVETPGPDFVWIGGYWDWDPGVRHYAWHAGRWERPPEREAHWVAPRYQFRGGKHYYARGHWDRRGGNRDRRDRDHRDRDRDQRDRD
jgi:hypothetical protein